MTAQPWMPDLRSVAAQALEAARAGAKVLVVRNTVGYAITTQQALEEIAERALLFSYEATLTLHHGRFAAADRRLLDHEVERRLGRDRLPGGMVVVGTQTLEQSLDIDADLLITDLCPVDMLLQRIGRLHRHLRDDRPDGYRDPRVRRVDARGRRPDIVPSGRPRQERLGASWVRLRRTCECWSPQNAWSETLQLGKPQDES